MKQRDREIKDEELKVESVKEEVVSRQLMIKEKRAFLATESENNIELEKKIEIRERQNGKLREQRQYIDGNNKLKPNHKPGGYFLHQFFLH